MSPWDQFGEYLWWGLWWKRLEEEMCFKSGVKKRRSDWWWQRWWWQCGSNLCRVVRRWKTKARCCMLKITVCNFERWGSRWSADGDNRRGSSTARRLNKDPFKKIRRLGLLYEDRHLSLSVRRKITVNVFTQRLQTFFKIFVTFF